ncbi:MAG: lipase, partial [Myxococcota bacterium]
DFVRDNLEEGALGETILSTLAEFAGQLIALLSGTFNEQDGVAALEALTSAGTAEFTSEFPIGVPTSACGEGPELVNGIYYYSWSGTGVLTNALDIGDLLLGASSLVYSEANDGLVGRCSSRFGRVIRDDYFLNHLDSVNQVLGLTSWFETDPKSLIRAHVNRLKNLGL